MRRKAAHGGSPIGAPCRGLRGRAETASGIPALRQAVEAPGWPPRPAALAPLAAGMSATRAVRRAIDHRVHNFIA